MNFLLKALYVGEGDLHDPKYDQMVFTVPFGNYENHTLNVDGHCMYSFNLYPTDTYMMKYDSNAPIYVTVAIGLSFLIMILAFCAYDKYVSTRNETIVAAAARSNVLLASLFPKPVRDRLVAEREQQERKTGAKHQLKSFLNKESEIPGEGSKSSNLDLIEASSVSTPSKPIADLFPETTILFADIAGFTAWSSQREPAQVFTLLETLYNAFDAIAVKRKIYKVETIGKKIFWQNEHQFLDRHTCVFVSHRITYIRRLLCGGNRFTRATTRSCLGNGSLCS